MKTRLRRPMTATVLMMAAALVLSNASQIGARVVCIVSDCHVDIEPSVCSCCSVNASDNEMFDFDPPHTNPSCSDCIDVPLSVPPLTSKPPQLSTPENSAEGRTAAPSCGGDCRINLVVRGNQMDQHWLSLVPLSTIVLLT